MHHDVSALKAFYYERALGRVVQRVLRDRMLDFWPSQQVTRMNVTGYGFAAPLLRPYLEPARRVTALMPGPQGAMAWPYGMPNHSVLCDEDSWPLDTGSVDRLVFLHALETAEHPGTLMAEAWRVLGPGGRLLIMAPNRTGLWARSEATPFGFGRSYTFAQLDAVANEAGFAPERAAAALYIPPSDRRFWLKSAQMWERTGKKISNMLVAGVIFSEYSKQVAAPVGRGFRITMPSPLNVLEGMARPRPAGRGAMRQSDAGP